MAMRARQPRSEAPESKLAPYRAKRDFARTPEPAGGTPFSKPSPALSFVIQKHAATRLHYDLRLEWEGVFKSWAVTRGPSYDTHERRLAVEVEDHPLEYGGFEGIIPKGEYGGGTVQLWDRGTWEPVGDAAEGLRKGELKFVLHGDKLSGRWVLVRMRPRPQDRQRVNWLLIKEHDGLEHSPGSAEITEERTESIASGRSIEQIATAADRVWSAKGEVQRPAPVIPGSAPKERLPEFVAPQLATLAERPPSGSEWVHEVKLDGYRVQARLSGGRVELRTRNGLDWTHRMPELVARLSKLKAKSALLDGEVVVLDERGISDFAALQAAFQDDCARPLTYFVFDLLHLDGHNLRGLAMEERKRLLRALLGADDALLRYGDHLEGEGSRILAEACRLGAEGTVSKRCDLPYVEGRSRGWIKCKCGRRQELVIAGFTSLRNGRDGVGALLLGYYENGSLVYAGRAGTGFSEQSGLALRRRLDALRVEKSALVRVPRAAQKDAQWVRPELVAEVQFATWTAEGLLRQASFKGLREDKPATEVQREQAAREAPTEKAVTQRAPRTTNRARPRLTHPDKLLDETSGVTKQQLADYYSAVAERMLPHVADRPLSIVRCPEGSGRPCFFQKHVTASLPEGLAGVDVVDRKSGKREAYLTLHTAEGLAALAQLGVLELHPWGSCNADIERADRVLFDLDPDESVAWPQVVETALELRRRLRVLGLESFVKWTGGKGLHVVVPVAPEHDWPQVKEFSRTLAAEMVKANPKLLLMTMSKAARKGKIFLDYLRNDRGSTAVAPYSPRARAGLPVALPLTWRELSTERPWFSVADFASWKHRLRSDPWAKMSSLRQPLPLKI